MYFTRTGNGWLLPGRNNIASKFDASHVKQCLGGVDKVVDGRILEPGTV